MGVSSPEQSWTAAIGPAARRGRTAERRLLPCTITPRRSHQHSCDTRANSPTHLRSSPTSGGGGGAAFPRRTTRRSFQRSARAVTAEVLDGQGSGGEPADGRRLAPSLAGQRRGSAEARTRSSVRRTGCESEAADCRGSDSGDSATLPAVSPQWSLRCHRLSALQGEWAVSVGWPREAAASSNDGGRRPASSLNPRPADLPLGRRGQAQQMPSRLHPLPAAPQAWPDSTPLLCWSQLRRRARTLSSSPTTRLSPLQLLSSSP